MPANAVMAKELDLNGTFRFGAEFDEAVRLISAGKIDPTELISARRPLTEAPAALAPGARPLAEREGDAGRRAAG